MELNNIKQIRIKANDVYFLENKFTISPFVTSVKKTVNFTRLSYMADQINVLYAKYLKLKHER